MDDIQQTVSIYIGTGERKDYKYKNNYGASREVVNNTNLGEYDGAIHLKRKMP